MLYLLSERDLAEAGNAVVTAQRVAPHQDVSGSGHAGAHVGTNEHLNVARASNRQADALCNQLRASNFTLLSRPNQFGRSSRVSERCPSGTIFPDAI